VIQINKVHPLPPIPKYKFDKKGANEGSESVKNSADRSSHGVENEKQQDVISDKGSKKGKADASASAPSKFSKPTTMKSDGSGVPQIQEKKLEAKKGSAVKLKDSQNHVVKEEGLKIDREQKKSECECKLL